MNQRCARLAQKTPFISTEQFFIGALLTLLIMVLTKTYGLSMNIFNEIEAPKPKFTLRKLPMWGEQVTPDEINFEWPT